MAAADVLSAELEEASSVKAISLRHPLTGSEQPAFPDGTPSSIEPLLEEVVREGKRMQRERGIEAARNGASRTSPGCATA